MTLNERKLISKDQNYYRNIIKKAERYINIVVYDYLE